MYKTYLVICNYKICRNICRCLCTEGVIYVLGAISQRLYLYMQFTIQNITILSYVENTIEINLVFLCVHEFNHQQTRYNRDSFTVIVYLLV